jgi:UDP-N-acetyl-D-mannosaminuronate dehydrogenase
MQQDMRRYTKFIGALDQRAASQADQHFRLCGLKTKTLSSPEATELGKLNETTYFGVLIAWAQEVERQCDLVGANYDEVVALCEEVAFFPPVKYVPGIIGGHCVMPNLELLAQVERSPLIEAIEDSNVKKIQREDRISTETETKPIAV